MTYSIDDHRHRFAAWAAGRAASVRGCRFKVEQARTIIDGVGLHELLPDPALLPDPGDLREVHRIWRGTTIEKAARLDLKLTHGVAAKLINVYLKAAFVCGGHHEHERVAALHPPVDGLLLDALAKRDLGGQGAAWKRARRLRWSRLGSEDYEAVIDAIRAAFPGEPLWRIEEHWRGFQ